MAGVLLPASAASPFETRGQMAVLITPPPVLIVHAQFENTSIPLMKKSQATVVGEATAESVFCAPDSPETEICVS
jgi:hypothetical protein